MKHSYTILLSCALTFHFLSSGSEFAKIERTAASLPTLRDYFHKEELSIENGRCQFKNVRKFQEIALIDLAAFEQALDRFTQIMQELLNKPDAWLGAKNRLAHILEPHPRTFLMYAQKLVLNQKDTVFFRGDLHGSVHALIAFIRHLQELGYLSKENEFKISKPDCYLIFLGDYVDRGLWGVEVIYLLLQLKIHNPMQVFLVRGNHEDPQIALTYGFNLELKEKFNGATDKQFETIFKKIEQFYAYLPIVLYVGAQTNEEEYDFLQACHGGLEMGFNPKALLSNANTQFETVHEIMRRTACFSEEYSECSILDENNTPKPLRALCKDFIPTSLTMPVLIGFAWHDFVVDPEAMSVYKPLRGFALNKKATDATFKVASTKKVRLIGLIRAHQHVPLNEDPLMKLLISSKGCAFLWQQLEKLCVTQGMVITLLLAPDTLTSMHRPNFFDGFEYDTCLQMTIGDTIANWELKVLNNLPYARKGALAEQIKKEHELQNAHPAMQPDPAANWSDIVLAQVEAKNDKRGTEQINSASSEHNSNNE